MRPETPPGLSSPAYADRSDCVVDVAVREDRHARRALATGSFASPSSGSGPTASESTLSSPNSLGIDVEILFQTAAEQSEPASLRQVGELFACLWTLVPDPQHSGERLGARPDYRG